MANFAITGVAGFIAPRHLDAIKALGHNLIAACDPNDSVGILDRYFPDCQFFTDFERFEAFIEEKKGTSEKMEYLAVCSPNHMHGAHAKFGLRHGANVICEKPLVLTTAELDSLVRAEKESGQRIYTVLQLRVHDAILALKEKVKNANRERHKVDLTYMTSRGNWYLESWKGDEAKSGGLSTNIGIHFFDMLTWIFGEVREVRMKEKSPTFEQGTLNLARADVNWSLTTDRRRLPNDAVRAGKTTFRSIRIDGEEFEFSEGFTELHKKVYQDILAGKGYGLEDARPAIEIAEIIRSAQPQGGP
jgi:UDP-N-acetyl-2-amino-2-deoxyglucuronate dehydrogenase